MTQPDKRGDRLRVARSALAAVLTLAAVAGAALVIGKGSPDPQHGEVRVGVPRSGPVPPTMVFASDLLGYARYDLCQAQTLADRCQATLMRTKDGGRTWTRLALPAAAAAGSGSLRPLQVSGDAVALSWAGGAAVSWNDGDAWTPVTIRLDGAVVGRTEGLVIDTGQGALALALDHSAKPVASRFVPDSREVAQLRAIGTADGGLWATDGKRLAVSTTGGAGWRTGSVAQDVYVRAPLIGPHGFYAIVSGPLRTLQSGIAGDGGELPASSVQLSDNGGSSWHQARVSGAAVNALCTVMLKDGSLLGVSLDGKSLLRLARGGTAFTAPADPPAAVPSCLSGGAGLVWGATFDGRFVLGHESAAGTTWSVGSLPADVHYGTLVPGPKASP